jgi:hypothetical protein
VGRTNYIEHKGRKILFVNFAHLEADELPARIEEAKAIIASQREKSVFVLTDVTGGVFSKADVKHLKAYVAHNEPYIWRSAVVGVEGILNVVFQGVVRFSGREDLMLKASLEEAKDRLANQPVPG